MTGQEFRQARQAYGFTVRGLARELGVAPSTICRAEKSRRTSLALEDGLMRAAEKAQKEANDREQ